MKIKCRKEGENGHEKQKSDEKIYKWTSRRKI